VNGSGKHNNWSLATDSGNNLFSPGKTPRQNARFLVFLAAFIKGIDEYQDFLRCTVASAGNDHRLGSHEAPPAIISIFLGDELNAVVKSIINDTNYTDPEKSVMRIGVDVLPSIPKDTTDRNRTSPFAFTGNKFEFRSLGSAASISDANVVLNTIVAESLRVFADELEKAPDFRQALHDLIVRTIRKHKRILFNGNNYADEWVQEAARRGLTRLESTVDALPSYTAEKNIANIEAICRQLMQFSEADSLDVSEDYFSFALNNLRIKDDAQLKLFMQLYAQLIELTDGECSLIGELADISVPDVRMVRFDVEANGTYTLEMAAV
jgi:glutamine synthetase